MVKADEDFLLDARADDVSKGTDQSDLVAIDASKALAGQCPTLRSSGKLSQFVNRAYGPYNRESPTDPRGASEREISSLGSASG